MATERSESRSTDGSAAINSAARETTERAEVMSSGRHERGHRILVVLTVLRHEREPGGARGLSGPVRAGAGGVLGRLVT